MSTPDKRLRSSWSTRSTTRTCASTTAPEFIAHAVADWCRFNRAGSILIDPGSPWQNAWNESFNGRLRDGSQRLALRGHGGLGGWDGPPAAPGSRSYGAKGTSAPYNGDRGYWWMGPLMTQLPISSRRGSPFAAPALGTVVTVTTFVPGDNWRS